ncbi:MAG TPA: HAMP domain-containing sensor histidine kinase [Gemmatimonadaceae bacterium]|jgi:signal transduction histidine kinase|nr:HAMP domain-containing sensor histidine kinase [Gemmatimonadaceae bacterium]
MTRTARPPMGRELRHLRLRLTAWYAGTLGVIVLLLGSGLFFVIRDRISQQLNASLRSAVTAIVYAADIRAMERTRAHGMAIDAVAELRIPDRELYLLDTTGAPIIPNDAASWIRAAAHRAATHDSASAKHKVIEGHILRLYARRFTARDGHMYVAAAMADQIELEDQYAALIVAFSATAFTALILFAGVGSFLTQKSIEPVEQTMTSMRRFMADAAHELRTPLTVLRTRAEVTLQRAYTAEEYQDALRTIEREAQHLGKIVEDLLLLARTDAGERPIARERLFLDDIALDAANAARSIAERRGVTLEVGAFDEAAVIGDAVLIRQLVLILLDNAIKFTPAGNTVRMSVTSEDGAALLRVDDHGIGIPADQLSHVFERFFRGDTARIRSDGAGLGLSIAQWIAEAHRATIEIQSTPGEGTQVAVRFLSVLAR